MFSPLAGTGLASFLPPTLTVRLKPCTNAVSTAPGCRTWQPVADNTTSTASPSTGLLRTWECIAIELLHHDGHLHVAVIGPAEVVANRCVGTCRVRSDCHIGRVSRLDISIDFQLAHEESVHDIFAVETQGHGLAFLQRDLIGSKSETLRRDLKHARTAIGIRPA